MGCLNVDDASQEFLVPRGKRSGELSVEGSLLSGGWGHPSRAVRKVSFRDVEPDPREGVTLRACSRAGPVRGERLEPGPSPPEYHYACLDVPPVNRREVTGDPGQSIKYGNFAQIALPRPPDAEQRAIADFLDRETARIDTLIATQVQLIATLDERRGAVIDDGLRRVRSGEKLKLGWLFSFHNGDRGSSYPSRDEMTEDGVPFINAGPLQRGHVDFAKMNYITDSKFDEMGGAKLLRGDILFCLRGSLGKVGLYDDRRPGALASSLVALRPLSTRTDVHYSMYLLESRTTRDQIDLAQTGTAQPNLAVSQLRQFTYTWPSAWQQRDVVKRLNTETGLIDDLMRKAERFIELARERRSALITAAVTGQLDVRGEVA